MTFDSEAAAPDDDILYPSVIPFLLVHLACLAAIWTGVTWPAVALCVALYWLRMFASHRRLSSLFLAPRLRDRPRLPVRPRLPRPSRARRRASCGGRPSTAITTSIRTRSRTCIRRAISASSTAMSAGSSRDATTASRSRQGGRPRPLSRAAAGCTGSSWCPPSCSAPSAFSSPAGRASSSASCGAPCWSGTPPSASTRWPMCAAASAT